jgi:hypothetical protein
MPLGCRPNPLRPNYNEFERHSAAPYCALRLRSFLTGTSTVWDFPENHALIHQTLAMIHERYTAFVASIAAKWLIH